MKPVTGDDSQVVEYAGQFLRFVRDCGAARHWVLGGNADVFIWNESAWEPFHYGAAGTEAVVSADGRHAAFFHWDGQGETGYEAFELQPTPRHLGGVPRVWGEAGAPAFTPDGRWLLWFVSGEFLVRGSNQGFDEVADDEDGSRVVVDWARLFVHRLRPGTGPDAVPVGVEIPLSTSYDDVVSQWSTDEALRFEADDTVTLLMPWGEELRVPLPAGGAVTSHGYAGD